jgi:hypothetical protein
MTQVLDQHYLAPGEVKVFRDDSNNLAVETTDGETWRKVTARLAFPYSAPDRFIILTRDGEEVGMIRDPAELDESSRSVMEDTLQKRYHIPEIERILSVEDAHNATRWSVETDRGPREFLVRDRHNFHRVKGGDTVVVDVDGNRFRIPRDRVFDKQSRKLLDMHG